MDYEKQIIKWIEEDPMRMAALEVAASLQLNDWCLAAGFVRNMVWDELHHQSEATPMNDIDLIYFDGESATQQSDMEIELELKSKSDFPWSVKNQARMHIRNNDASYSSTSNAMCHWVEVETAIGAFLSSKGEVKLIAPFGVEELFGSSITINPMRIKPEDFFHRIESKRWLELWPNLKIVIA